MKGFFTGARGGKSSTRLMTLSSFFAGVIIAGIHCAMIWQGKQSDLIQWGTLFLGFSASLQGVKSYIEEKYIDKVEK